MGVRTVDIIPESKLVAHLDFTVCNRDRVERLNLPAKHDSTGEFKICYRTGAKILVKPSMRLTWSRKLTGP